MNNRILTATFVSWFILGLFFLVVDGVQAGAEPSPSASAGQWSSSASVSVSVTNLQSYATEGQSLSGTAYVYANSYPDTKKKLGVEIYKTIGIETYTEKVWVEIPGVGGVEETITRKKSYIKASKSASIRNWGTWGKSKWALAKGTVSGVFKRRWANYKAPDTGSGS